MKKNLLKIVLSASLLTTTVVTPLLATTQTKKPAKPFLIQGKLPHLTMMVKAMWDDADLALTKEQKQKLLVVRKDTISAAKKLGQKIFKLENKVAQLSKNGAKPSEIQKYVYEIASYRAEATMVHLKCIYNTRKILTQDQLDILE